MKTNTKMLLLGLIQAVVSGLILFWAAGTFNYWQLWVYIVVAALSIAIPSCYLLRTNPVALERRMRVGPTAETRMVQKVLVAGLYLSVAAMFVVSALDHRFGWSSVPTAICVIGDVLVAVGLIVQMLVVIQNSHAASTVRVESGQVLVSTGLYGLVRHPMYAGVVMMMFGIPPALGSYWGLVFVIPGLIVLVLRIRDEEKLLQDELDGYRDYAQKVRSRVVPYVW